MKLSIGQQDEVMGKLEDIFTDIPGKTSILEHMVHLIGDCLIRHNPYALPYPVREIQEVIQVMINNPETVHELESNSPNAS